ncbi:MAG: hydroxylamine reductase [Candidatus Omnitrophica bacterium]|nr:hydroxylamine reductase [Candidatus Omnitrophota bacterium]MBU4458171.1 hydroxylamine reductase [Candidatus Omnitrophota bacterium]
MFCYQCEQTAGGKGCTKVGICGKNEDIQSLQDTLIFGLKGIAAYAYHARRLGAIDEDVDAFMHEGLFTTLTNTNFDLNQHLEAVLKCGQMNIKIMELLDKANTWKFGNPVPTEVETGTKKGPGILITGHDLLDLYELLKQTEGTGINIYTHGEMLPAHGYPKLKKFKHLVGNFGGAWQEQKKEFKGFPGAIFATTNCVQIPPDNAYVDRFFTTGIVGVPGAQRINDHDYSKLIEKAKSLPGLAEAPGKKIMTGFHHTAVLGLADKIVRAVKSGKIKHFFLIGGCDGAKPGRNYYTQFAESVPKDCVILTLACGKYRFNKLDFGSIDGIPRLLDVGQCNNAYSAVQIALALSDAFKTDVNGLPLTLVLSWYEQKAVAILLSLLYLGIKGMYIGPTPPAFISGNVFKMLQEKFDLKLTGEPKKDLESILHGSKCTA